MCVARGGLGIVVPGLPTTIFFIGAAACFTRSSPRLGLPRIGPAVRDYRAGLGMPRAAKRAAITMLTISVGISLWFLPSWTIRGIVVAAGVIGVWFILRQPTRTGS